MLSVVFMIKLMVILIHLILLSRINFHIPGRNLEMFAPIERSTSSAPYAAPEKKPSVPAALLSFNLLITTLIHMINGGSVVLSLLGLVVNVALLSY